MKLCHHDSHFVDPIRVTPADLIMVLESVGIKTCSIMSIGGDASAGSVLNHGDENKLWTEGEGEGYNLL